MRALAVAVALCFGVEAQIGPLADGCVVTMAAGCDSTTLGQLAPGDCTTSLGELVDSIDFAVSAGQEFVLTLRPLAATYTNPALTLRPPPGDASTTPIVVGGEYGAVWFRATSTGNWRAFASSSDPSARGAYALHIDCVPDEAPGQPPGCIIQELACNQTGGWRLDANSCRFDDGRPYNQWAVWGVEGDDLRLDMTSVGFAPLFAIYDEDSLLKTSTNDGSRGAVMTYRIPRTGWYWVTTTTRSGAAGGSYEIEMQCSSSGCLQPWFTAPVADVTVPDGGLTITPPVDYYGGGTLTLQLVDATNAGVHAQSQGTSVQAPEVTKPTRVFLRAINECGENNSNVFLLKPDAPPRRRVVRH